jgi:hypothetical protein
MGRCKQAPKRQRVDVDNSHDRPTSTESSLSSSSALDALFRDSHVHKDQREAIETLLAAPDDAVEAAAAEATRLLIETWPQIDALVPIAATSHSKAATTTAAVAFAATTTTLTSGTTSTTDFATGIAQPQASLPSCFKGLAKCTLSPEDFEVLQDFNQAIQERAQEWTSWSGSPIDPRRRVFGFLPNSFLGLSTHSNEDNESPMASDKDHIGRTTSSWNWKDQIDVTMPLQQQQSTGNENNTPLKVLRQTQQEAPEKERQRNARAMVSLGENGDEDWLLSNIIPKDTSTKEPKAKLRPHQLRHAIFNLLDAFRPHAPSRVQPYLSLPNLVAAQPNLHCGRHLLPAHVDHPLKDGFGICIITIAMKGNAQLFLEESTLSSSRSSSHQGEAASRGVMSIHKGQAYLLSGPARNQCTHGVLAHDDCSDRESLNLRFGLHGVILPQSENAPSVQSKEDCGTHMTSTKAEVISPDEVLQYW